ncbi:26S proteasome non-ATPase regulatory subunit 9 [Kappamyces sp. JEL0829]|nr:26S proteasome non-ATPase regulatory subunit 9 [Kappamyces sp. JEL0829]
MTIASQRQKQVEECKKLVRQKEELEQKIQEFESVLRSQGVGMQTPLVDQDGFPRGDLDLYAIREAKSALAPLYNDLESKMAEIEKALHLVHATPADDAAAGEKETEPVPMARVNGVFPDSPASLAGLRRDDLILSFGELDQQTKNPLQEIAKLLPQYEYKVVKVRVRRQDQPAVLHLVPKPWEGRGLLGCHLGPV